jgi:hypothetical protein
MKDRFKMVKNADKVANYSLMAINTKETIFRTSSVIKVLIMI